MQFIGWKSPASQLTICKKVQRRILIRINRESRIPPRSVTWPLLKIDGKVLIYGIGKTSQFYTLVHWLHSGKLYRKSAALIPSKKVQILHCAYHTYDVGQNQSDTHWCSAALQVSHTARKSMNESWMKGKFSRFFPWCDLLSRPLTLRELYDHMGGCQYRAMAPKTIVMQLSSHNCLMSQDHFWMME